MFDQTGLMCIRRKVADGEYYFIANRGDKRIDGWIPIASETRSAVLMNPLNGETGVAASRATGTDSAEIYLQLEPGESVIARILAHRTVQGAKWNDWKTDGDSVELKGTWSVKFVKGGPELPAPFTTGQLASWTKLGDTNAQRFAGSAVYTLKFDAPAKTSDHYRLDLGKVCQSARVRLNGRDLGTLITPPFCIEVENLKPKENVLEVEVTNVSANRIRDLDRRGVNWKYFHDINFVDINYHRFDASNWPLTDSGLLGPVTLTPLAAAQVE
jgi:hypothetical protein